MAELRHWHDVCLTMSMFKRLGRLFVIKTRWEAFLVIYAIADLQSPDLITSLRSARTALLEALNLDELLSS